MKDNTNQKKSFSSNHNQTQSRPSSQDCRGEKGHEPKNDQNASKSSGKVEQNQQDSSRQNKGKQDQQPDENRNKSDYQDDTGRSEQK